MVPINDIFAELRCGKKLTDFYCQLVSSTAYKYVIIVPRKCMTELKCLCKENLDWDFQDNVHYMTPKSFVQYKDMILADLRDDDKEISILIADDILMYGRGINQVLMDIVKSVSEGEPDSEELQQKMIDCIHIDVFIESNRNFIVNEEFRPIIEERMNCYISYNEFQNVLRASDLFLESFYANLIPNTSFVNAWYFKSKEIGDEAKSYLDAKIQNPQDTSLFSYTISAREEQAKYGFHSTVYYEEQRRWMNKIAEFYCIRFYCNDDDKPLLVPYVFLKPMTGEQIDALLGKFHDVLNLPQIWEGQTDAHYILKFEYLTKLISDCYGLVFMTKYMNSLYQAVPSWNTLYEEDKIVTEFTFGRDNVLPMDVLRNKLGTNPEEILKDILEDFSADYAMTFKEESDSGRLFNESLNKLKTKQDNPTFYDILNSFFKSSNLQDERQAEEGKKRYFGLSTIRINYILKQQNYLSSSNASELYGEMIRCMDTGASSISIKKITNDGKSYFGAIINSGEQAYRFMQEELSPIIHYLALIEKDCLNLCMSSQTDTKINEFFNNIANNNSLFENISEMVNAIKERNGRYTDVDVHRSGYENRLFNPIYQKAYEQMQY